MASKSTKRRLFAPSRHPNSGPRGTPPTIDREDLQLLNGSRKAGIAPAFSLRALDGHLVKLTELLRSGPVVVSFHAAAHCEHCQSQVLDLTSLLPEIERLGARWVAIGPTSSRHRAKRVRAALLSDPGARVAQAYGLAIPFAGSVIGHAVPGQRSTGVEHFLIPATYIINRDGQIAYACTCLRECNTIARAELVTLLTSLALRHS